MGKELGQIHSVNQRYVVTAAGDNFYTDLAGQLTEQLQTLVRCGTYHKLVGVDMNITTLGTLGGGQITGSILYYYYYYLLMLSNSQEITYQLFYPTLWITL